VIVFAVKINGRSTARSAGRVMRRSIWFWLLVAVLAVLLLGLLFGGYRKGTKVGLSTSVPPVATVAV
jgi:hypothetical protein